MWTQRNWTLFGIQNSYNGYYSQWRSANKWGSDSVRLRLSFILRSTGPRGYASSSIAWKTLWRSRILQWVDQCHKPQLSKNCRIIQCNTENYMPIVVPGFSTASSSSTSSTSPTSLPQDLTVEDYTPNPASTRCRSTSSWALGDQLHDSDDTEDRNKEIDPEPGMRSDDLQEWLEDFTENLVDERVSASRDTPASTSGESDSEPPKKVVLAKHSIFSHLPKDRNCEACKRTNITMVTIIPV